MRSVLCTTHLFFMIGMRLMKEIINTKQYVCEVCGRIIEGRSYYSDGKVVCNKHHYQFKKFGQFLDNNPRTIYDKNEIIIYGDIAHVILYNIDQYPIGYAIIDTDDIYKVQDIKWHLNINGYAVNSGKGHPNIYMHRVVLGIDEPVDHINGNRLDNRKCNLRPITKSQNQMNSYHKGYSTLPDGRFTAHIKYNQRMANLGTYQIEEEAAYARWFAEKLVFRHYAYEKPEPQIPEYRKREIQYYVEMCLERLYTRLGTYPLTRLELFDYPN